MNDSFSLRTKTIKMDLSCTQSLYTDTAFSVKLEDTSLHELTKTLFRNYRSLDEKDLITNIISCLSSPISLVSRVFIITDNSRVISTITSLNTILKECQRLKLVSTMDELRKYQPIMDIKEVHSFIYAMIEHLEPTIKSVTYIGNGVFHIRKRTHKIGKINVMVSDICKHLNHPFTKVLHII